MIRALALLSVVFAAAASSAEETAEKEQARALLAQGNALFAKGDLKGALVVFRAAYSLFPSPKLLVNTAAAERELGDLAGAANDLRRFLDAAEDDPLLAERARNDLRALEGRLGRLATSGWPAQVSLEVDGRPAREPLFYVKPGTHAVRVRAPGEEALERTIEARPGETVELPRLLFPGRAPAPVARPPRRRWWLPVVVVASVVVVGGAIGLGVGLTSAQAAPPLKSDLGTFKFSDFH